MGVAVFVHLQPAVPAGVLPLGIKPPAIPLSVMSLAILEIVLVAGPIGRPSSVRDASGCDASL